MSSKSKLIIGIVILAVGAGLIPTGLIANDYLRDEVYDGVPEAMTKIKRDALPGLMEQIPVLATPEVLLGVQAEATAGLEPMVALLGTPQALLGMRDEINASIPGLIDVVTTANIISTSLAWADFTYGAGNGSEYLFNDVAYVDGWAFLQGVTNFINSSIFPTTNMSYTPSAQQNLLYNGFFDAIIDGYYTVYGFPSPVSGLISDLDMGTGIGDFLTYYWTADYFGNYSGTNMVFVDTYPADAMVSGYGASWWQLSAIAYWLDFIFTYYVPTAFWNAYQITVAEAVANGFYIQWANGTLVPNGVDLGGYKGYEAGIPAPTNISLSTSMALWNASNPLSFVNETGIKVWAAAMQLDPAALLALGVFGLTPTQLTMVLSWLGNFINNVTPALIYDTYAMTLTDIATPLFYEQWANGTIMGSAELPGGFLAEIDASFAGAPYIEAGLPNATGLSLMEAMDLWDSWEDMAFTNPDGFEDVWLPAMAGDTGNYTALTTEFGISNDELDDLLGWLAALIDLAGDPATGRVAKIIEFKEGVSIEVIATLAVYEQWANGTINGEEILPEGFLSRRDPPIYGPPYFELGLMYPVIITEAQVLALWDTTSPYSLLTVSGVHKWYSAKAGNTIYVELQDENGGLNDIQMGAILKWLPQFRDIIVNKLAKDDRDLPMRPYELGETLALSLGIGGGALAALGIVFLILSRRT